MKYIRTIELFDNKGNRKYLNCEERKCFYNSTKSFDPYIGLFGQMLYWTGARISEILNLKINQIDFSEQVVLIESLKKRKKGLFRQIPLPTYFLKELEQYIIEIPSVDSLIWNYSRSSASRYIKAIMGKANLNGTHASSKGLRHGFAVHCIFHNIPLTLIQKWMGHASITTTSIYLNVVGIEERQFAQRMWGSVVDSKK